jgi:hypothetical protein
MSIAVFLIKKQTEKHYVAVSQITTVILMLLSAIVRFTWTLSPMPGSSSSCSAPAPTGLYSALVLVAHQRLERGVSHARRFHHLSGAAVRLQAQRR